MLFLTVFSIHMSLMTSKLLLFGEFTVCTTFSCLRMGNIMFLFLLLSSFYYVLFSSNIIQNFLYIDEDSLPDRSFIDCILWIFFLGLAQTTN